MLESPYPEVLLGLGPGRSVAQKFLQDRDYIGMKKWLTERTTAFSSGEQVVLCAFGYQPSLEVRDCTEHIERQSPAAEVVSISSSWLIRLISCAFSVSTISRSSRSQPTLVATLVCVSFRGWRGMCFAIPSIPRSIGRQPPSHPRIAALAGEMMPGRKMSAYRSSRHGLAAGTAARPKPGAKPNGFGRWQ